MSNRQEQTMNQTTKVSDPKKAGERLLTFLREGRLVQAAWRNVREGREFSCLLGAAAGIEDEEDCPASLMPQWVARALPGLHDGQTHAHSFAFAFRWGEAMIRPEWKRIDWDEVRSQWMAFVLKQAQDTADRTAYHAAVAAPDSVLHARSSGVAFAAACVLSCVEDHVARLAAETVAAEAVLLREVARATAYYNDAHAAAEAAVRDAQADALMSAIERAMEI